MIHSEWLETFVSFATNLGFTAAARELGMSQPAVHVQIQKLAEQVGVPLYRRVGRNVELTAEGQKLLAYGREERERARAMLRELGRTDAIDPLVLASGEGALRYLLGPAIRSFVQKESAPLRVLTRDAPGTIAAVQSGEAHVGVTVVETVPDGLVLTPLVDVGIVVAVPRAHRLAKKRAIGLRDLEGERLVVPPKGRPFRRTLANALATNDVGWEPAIEAGGWDLALHFASLGLGLAVVHDFCAIPKGLVARKLHALGRVRYALLRRRKELGADEPLMQLTTALAKGAREARRPSSISR